MICDEVDGWWSCWVSCKCMFCRQEHKKREKTSTHLDMNVFCVFWCFKRLWAFGPFCVFCFPLKTQAMQGFGPRGADLLLRCTAAATELGLRRPELLKEKEMKTRWKRDENKTSRWNLYFYYFLFYMNIKHHHFYCLLNWYYIWGWWHWYISYENERMNWWCGRLTNGRRSPRNKNLKGFNTKNEIRKGKSVAESNESKCLKRSPDVFFWVFLLELFSFSLTFRDVKAVTSLRLASCFENVWKQMQHHMETKKMRNEAFLRQGFAVVAVILKTLTMTMKFKRNNFQTRQREFELINDISRWLHRQILKSTQLRMEVIRAIRINI